MTIPQVYQGIINRWKKANPMFAHTLGFHEYDGQVPNFSKEFMNNRISEVKNDIRYLQDMGEPDEKLAKYEFNLVLSTLETELWTRDVQREYTQSPMPYVFPLWLIEGSYTSRSFAPLETRVKSLTSLLENLPEMFDQARDQLEESIPRAKIGMGLMMLKGFHGYLKDKLITFVSQVEDSNLLSRWAAVNEKAVAAMEKFMQDLETVYMPKAHDNFALGEERFLEMLEHTERVKTTVERLLEIGEADLRRNYDEMMKIANDTYNWDSYLEELRNDYPAVEELLEYTKLTLERTKQFVIDSDMVDIPTDSQCEVVDMPEAGKKFGFAAMNTPGPYEPPEASEAYYYVNVPNPAMSEEEKGQLMQFFNKSFLEVVTVHEAWPGHYLQLLFNNKVTSDIAKHLAYSGSMIEGFGHYCEEMMYQEGYEPFDRKKLHIGQLFGALTRNVRYISAVKMHCTGMTVDESKALFLEKGYLPESLAQIEANRGTVNPMYLYYTLGKLMIMKLREDYKKEKGDSYTLKAFHNELLSYGSPPISIVRKMMLENPGGMEEIL